MDKKKLFTLNNCLKDFKSSWSDLDNVIQLKDNWEQIVGRDLAQECKPLKIEKSILTIVANHPQWRQELIYYRHKLKESISKKGIKLKSIRIIQSYSPEEKTNISLNKSEWLNHPSRIKNSQIVLCNLCKCPTPQGEIDRWGKCTFCWRKDN